MSEILARIRVRETAGIRRFLYPLSVVMPLPEGAGCPSAWQAYSVIPPSPAMPRPPPSSCLRCRRAPASFGRDPALSCTAPKQTNEEAAMTDWNLPWAGGCRCGARRACISRCWQSLR